MTRWLWTFQAIDPRDFERTWTVGVPEWLYRKLQRQGHEKQVARLLLVHEVLLPEGTLQIRAGWSRPGQDECFVYVGRPSRDLKSMSIETPAPPNMVFLVFVLPDGTIDDWTWRQIAAGEAITPDGVTGDLIWPPSKTC